MPSLRQAPTVWWEVIGYLQPAVAGNPKTQTLLAEFNELNEGLRNSQFAMHAREFHNAFDTGKKYLGEDVVATEKAKEFEAFSPEKKKEITAQNHGGLGQYGPYFHSQKQELMLALEVLTTLKAREIINSEIAEITDYRARDIVLSRMNMDREVKNLLEDELIVNSILATFPEGKIQNSHIDEALVSCRLEIF